ncbi:LCP family protein [Clostridium massiliamazoniense]|uniref:LCP family protein n=1 Tax=Clostridium massiliamazoniense TaxID=1347366 RepID=UPI0006D77F82|nr:LCP family protein [Clostridium massiliamazoniense]
MSYDKNSSKKTMNKRPNNSTVPSRKKKKKNKKKIILLSIIFLMLFAVVSGGTYVFFILSKINTQKIDKDLNSLGISDDKFHDDVVNIALFGIDGRTKNERGRSDATMVASFDKKHKKIKLTSIMRDSYVSIDGHGEDKLNHAYAFGGPQLAIKTLNQNFGLNIKDYISVNFEDLAHIIDNLGGVKINIKDYEVKYVNDYVKDVSLVTGLAGNPISGAGEQTLSGVQAVAYSRIRYVGDGDYERTQRQRTILEGLFNKINALPASKLPSVISNLLPYVETSLTTTDLISLGTQILSSGISDMEQERFPTDEHSEGKIFRRTPNSTAQWYLTFDKEITKKQIFNYINEDIKPVN